MADLFHVPVEVQKRPEGVSIVNEGAQAIRGRDGMTGEKVHDGASRILALVEGKNGLVMSREIARRVQVRLGKELDVQVDNLRKFDRSVRQIDVAVNHAMQHVLREIKQVQDWKNIKETEQPTMVKIVTVNKQGDQRLYVHGDNVFILKKSGIIERLPQGDARGKLEKDELVYKNFRDVNPGDRVIVVNQGVMDYITPADLLREVRLRPENDVLAERFTQEFSDDQTGIHRHERTREMSVVVYTVKREAQEVQEVQEAQGVGGVRGVEQVQKELARLPVDYKFDPLGNELRRLRLKMEIAALQYHGAKSETDRLVVQKEYHRLKKEKEDIVASQHQKVRPQA